VSAVVKGLVKGSDRWTADSAESAYVALITRKNPESASKPFTLHPPSDVDALTRSLRQFGFVQPVLARREDGTVIAGHQRLVAARRLGTRTRPASAFDESEVTA
jgi:ParB-like nuclease domain